MPKHNLDVNELNNPTERKCGFGRTNAQDHRPCENPPMAGTQQGGSNAGMPYINCKDHFARNDAKEKAGKRKLQNLANISKEQKAASKKRKLEEDEQTYVMTCVEFDAYKADGIAALRASRSEAVRRMLGSQNPIGFDIEFCQPTVSNQVITRAHGIAFVRVDGTVIIDDIVDVTRGGSIAGCN